MSPAFEVRIDPTAAPALRALAIADDTVVGHALFTAATLHCYQAPYTVVALSDVDVQPPWRHRGVGVAVVRAGLDACRAAGHDVVVAIGPAAFLGPLGFVPARPLGLLPETPVAEETFLVAELTPNALRGRRGVVMFRDGFGT
jgi:putative acetyltransferase